MGSSMREADAAEEILGARLWAQEIEAGAQKNAQVEALIVGQQDG
jgi:hypothetical protein